MDILVRVLPAPASGDKSDEGAARSLIDELNAIPKISAALGADQPAPPGSKAFGIDPQVIIGLGGGALIPTLVNAIRDWLVRQPPATTIRFKQGDFEFEWGGSTPPAQVNDLIAKLSERWIA